jgi:hypothetical protein
MQSSSNGKRLFFDALTSFRRYRQILVQPSKGLRVLSLYINAQSGREECRSQRAT